MIQIIKAMLNGARKGWIFSDVSDGIEFNATVEDEKFLLKVKSGKIRFENGTSIRAVLRTVPLLFDCRSYSIVEVIEVIQPEGKNEFIA